MIKQYSTPYQLWNDYAEIVRKDLGFPSPVKPQLTKQENEKP